MSLCHRLGDDWQTERFITYGAICGACVSKHRACYINHSNILSHNNVRFLLFFIKKRIICLFCVVWVFCMPACVCAHHKMQYSGRPEDFCRSLTTGVADVCESPCGFLSTELSLYAKAVFLMTETSLQPCLLLLTEKKICSLEIISFWLIYSISIHICNLFLIVFNFSFE